MFTCTLMGTSIGPFALKTVDEFGIRRNVVPPIVSVRVFLLSVAGLDGFAWSTTQKWSV